MLKNQWQTLKLGLVASITALVIALGAIAITPVNTLAQITSITQIVDVQPTDYYYPALKSLVEKYSCTVGFPDDTFRGNRNMTRYEVVGAMNACMDQIGGFMVASYTNGVTKAEVTSLKNLINELQQEVELIQRSRASGKPRI
ncbi:iron uptake porin [Microcoleus vaginatus DQ-U2]|uniref:iron uptake porin n=1 Tax=Microcoleus vaginatus TaxID=119532 RepID=UPI00168A24E8|nr:iron uptake porin [Microcoleus sp. FACHB-DQ6]